MYLPPIGGGAAEVYTLRENTVRLIDTKLLTSVMISNLKLSLRDEQCIFLHYSYPQVVLVHGVVRRLNRVEHYESKLTTLNNKVVCF